MTELAENIEAVDYSHLDDRPWAIVLKDAVADTGAAAGLGIGTFALVEGALFIAILFLGLAYVWVKGDLDWVLSFSGPEYRPKQRPDRNAALPSVGDIEGEESTDEEEGSGDGETSGDTEDGEEAA